MNFGELQTEALGDDFDRTKYGEKVKRYINEGQARVARRISAQHFEAEQELALVGGQQSYTLPANIVRLRSVHVLSTWTQLGQMELDDLQPFGNERGEPVGFAMRGEDEILLWPTPAAEGSVLVRFSAAAPLLTADGDVPTLPSDYHDLLVTYARARLYRAEEDLEVAAALMAEFRQDVAEARGDLQRPSLRRSRQVPGMWAAGRSVGFTRPG